MEKMIYGNLSRPKGVCCKMTGFCFKQKTAYEMRISEWSSDVCSADLRERQRAIAGVPARAIEKQILAGLKSEHRQRGKVVAPRFAAEQDREKIGRASCRERVCQYVEIEVVGVSLKKKTQPQYTHKNTITRNLKPTHIINITIR